MEFKGSEMDREQEAVFGSTVTGASGEKHKVGMCVCVSKITGDEKTKSVCV